MASIPKLGFKKGDYVDHYLKMNGNEIFIDCVIDGEEWIGLLKRKERG